MINDATPKLDLPYLAEGQALKHLTVNEALGQLDGLVQCAVESRTVTAQPGSPTDGAVYLLPIGRTGAEWGLHPVGSLLRFETNAWAPLAAPVGMLVFVKSESLFVARSAGGWVELSTLITALQNLTRLGIGTTADATNPLSAKLNKALFTARTAAEGGDGDLRLTLNKETATDVLSILMQTGFSGRAELGLTGDDDLTLKVSANGTTWTSALNVRRQDGAVGVGSGAVAGRALQVGVADNGQVNANVFADMGGNISGLACFGGNLYPRSSDNSLRLRYTHGSFGGAALVLHRQVFNDAEIVFAPAGAADSAATVQPAARWRAGDRSTKLFGPLYLADYATGSLPAAASCPGAIVNDTTLNRAVRSDGSAWVAL